MKLFSHKQQKHELKIESEDELSVEDILAEYEAEVNIHRGYGPRPDGRGEYYSSSQGGNEDYYDSESYEPEYRSASSAEEDYYAAHAGQDQELDAAFDRIFAGSYAAEEVTLPGYGGYSRPDEPADEADAYSGYDIRRYGGDGGTAAAAPVHSGSIGAMEQDALDYISRLRQEASVNAAPKKEIDLYAPIQEDERPYEGPAAIRQEPSGEEIDGRFNLSGRRDRKGFFFGSRHVDTSADEDYAPAVQEDYNLSHWAPEAEGADEAPEEDEDGGKGLFKKRRRKAREGYSSDYDTLPQEEDESDSYAQGFRDHRAAPGDYARADDYDEYYYDGDYGRPSRQEKDYESGDDLPSFREYVASLFASAFLRIRGTNREVTAGTMNDSEEELGPELTPASACRYYGSFMRSQKLRLRIAAVLELLLCYISLELPLTGMLQHLPVTAAACCALQFAIMLMCLDVFTNGILNAVRLKFGADFLAVLSCLMTTADGLMVALYPSAALHIPLCAVSSLSLIGVLLASSLSTRGIRKAFRVPSIGKNFYSVTGEAKLRRDEITLLKSSRSARGFVRRTEEAAPDETLFIKLGPAVIVLALVLSLIVVALKKSLSDFLFVFSAILAPAAPFCALLSFALPYFAGSVRIFRSGAAIAGWSGLCDIGSSRSLIVTDRDLFPEESIEVDSVRIFSDESTEKVISYAGALISASGAGCSACFAGLMEENSCKPRRVENFEYLSGGGLKGIIEGHVVLCGGMELMRLMNVRIPYRYTGKTSVLLAIDGILYGIFTLKYTPLPQVRRALVELVRSGRHPVFAIRDFNVNPEMLHNTFDIATDGYDFPPYVERFAMSEPSPRDSKISAVICNEGLGPLTDVADVGRSMYLSIRLNLVCAALSAVLGSLLVFVKLLSAGSVTIGFLLLFLLVWAVPALLGSLYVASKP